MQSETTTDSSVVYHDLDFRYLGGNGHDVQLAPPLPAELISSHYSLV